jgi:F-type H+-transporting ATPase subunit a
MTAHAGGVPELPNIISILAGKFPQNHFFSFLFLWENVVFSLFAVLAVGVLVYCAGRRLALVPSRGQSFLELFVDGADNFICGVLGPQGRHYTPFIGTLFLYIVVMNIMGLVPMLKAPTSSWSTTLALAMCVFFYVQFTGIRKLGFLGYMDHLAGKPRGVLAFSAVVPLLLFVLHVLSELIRPLSLSLRLRSNIWGDDLLLAVLAGFGLKGMPLLVLNIFSGFLVAIIQGVVFCMLSTIYFSLVLTEE